MDVEHTHPQLIIRANDNDIKNSEQIPSAPRSHIVPVTTKGNHYGSKVSNYFEPTIKTH